MRMCMSTLLPSHVQLFVTLWTVVCQALLSMGFPRQDYWNGLLFPSPGDLPDPGWNSSLLSHLHWQADSLPLSHQEAILLLCTWACLVAQLCLTLCDPMDCSPPDSSVHGIFPGRNTGVGCHSLLQGIFPTQGSNACLLSLLH